MFFLGNLSLGKVFVIVLAWAAFSFAHGKMARGNENTLLVLDCQKISGIPKFLVPSSGHRYHFPQDRVLEQLATSLDGFKEFRTPYQPSLESDLTTWSNEGSELTSRGNILQHRFEHPDFKTEAVFECQSLGQDSSSSLCQVKRRVTLNPESNDAATEETSGSCVIKRWKVCDFLADVQQVIQDHRKADLRGPAHSSWKTGHVSNQVLHYTQFLSLKYSCRDKDLANEEL